MSLKARTPIIEHEDSYAIVLGGDRPPQERDRLTDQAMVIAYDRGTGEQSRWHLRAIFFDRNRWTRSGIRRWWAAHEVRLVAVDQPEVLVPEVCRAYEAPKPSLPSILLCHRNTPMSRADRQIASLKAKLRRNPALEEPSHRA